MEPGHEDREYLLSHDVYEQLRVPQWSPVMKTGNTAILPGTDRTISTPQWSPVMKTGNTRRVHTMGGRLRVPQWSPVMKTGNTSAARLVPGAGCTPQWSPVMKTGNTCLTPLDDMHGRVASMEPGHEDREYGPSPATTPQASTSLNGARS